MADLQLRNRFGVQVVLVRHGSDDGQGTASRRIPGPDLVLEQGDMMLLLGTPEGLNQIG